MIFIYATWLWRVQVELLIFVDIDILLLLLLLLLTPVETRLASCWQELSIGGDSQRKLLGYGFPNTVIKVMGLS